MTATTLITSTAYPSTATTSSAPSSTSTAASSKSSSNISVGPIIGGVVGGVVVLSLIAMLLVLYRQRRKKSPVAKKEKRSTAEQTTYTGLNSSFSGVPFARSPNRELHDSLLPAPLFSPSNSPYSRVEMRGGETSPYSLDRHSGETSPPSRPGARHGGQASPYSLERHGGQASPYSLPGETPRNFESERFLYANSSSTADRESLGRIDTSHHNDIVSPISVHDTPTHRNSTTISPQSPEQIFDAPAGISVPMFLAPQTTRDTMGFPVDSPIEQRRPSFPVEPDVPDQQDHHSIESEFQDIPIAAPSTRRQNTLECLIRDGMVTPEPSHQISSLRRPARVLSESPVLGNRHTVKMYAPPPLSGLQHSIRRNESQRTVSSMGSMGHVVSDEELDRLGVGRI